PLDSKLAGVTHDLCPRQVSASKGGDVANHSEVHPLMFSGVNTEHEQQVFNLQVNSVEARQHLPLQFHEVVFATVAEDVLVAGSQVLAFLSGSKREFCCVA